MQALCTDLLEMGHEKVLTHSPHEYLALIDVETYEPFVSKEVDHLDMMAHLYTQSRALTALAWGAPHKTLRISFHLTDSDHTVQRLSSHSDTVASGWLRTQGELCLTSHDRLFDCAAHRTHRILRDQRRLTKLQRPQLLHVPPGIYSVFVRYHFPFPFGGGNQWDQPHAEPKVHYTVVLRHYPFPAPRVAPIRLPGLVPWAA